MLQRSCLHQEDRSREGGEEDRGVDEWFMFYAHVLSNVTHVCVLLTHQCSYYLSGPQVEVIGGADKYQAVCRKCYGNLMVDKENSAPLRNETLKGKPVDSRIPTKILTSLHI